MRRMFAIGAVVFALDQATKYYVVHQLRLAERLAIDVWPPFLSLRMAWNRGVNFGLLANDAETMRWVLVALALAISAWVVLWIRRRPQSAVALVAAGLLVGGAMGNVVDRLVYGAVADFLNMSCCGIDNPFAFNVADVAVFLGAVGLVLFAGPEKTP